MVSETQSRFHRLAVLIDADNANADLIEVLLNEIAKYGTAHVKRIYGDWTNSQLGKWKEKLNKFAIQPIQQFAYTVGKNSTDSALIIDAMDLLYTQNFEGFCIVSSDSDFTRLASRIRESGLLVYGFGEKKTPESFISACDKFIYTEILEKSEFLTASQSQGNGKEETNKSTKNTSSEKTEDSGTQKLKRDKKLVKLLKDAYDAIADENEWIHLGPFGSQINKLSPSFDARNYGYKKLSTLIEATGIFEVKKLSKDIQIKLKL